MTFHKKFSLSITTFQPCTLMNRLSRSSLLLLLMTTVLSISSSAKEVDSLYKAHNLLSSCNALKAATKHAETVPCLNYIEGFLNGILNANSLGVVTKLENNQKSATLVERAYVNRVSNKTRNMTATAPVNYSCLSISEQKKLIIENLSDNTLSSNHSLEQLNDRLVHVLKTTCTTERKSE